MKNQNNVEGTTGSVSEYVPQWQEKVGWMLFPRRHAEMPELVGMKDGIVHRITINLSFVDRIRFLFSGWMMVDVKTATEGKIGQHRTATVASVIPPKCLSRR